MGFSSDSDSLPNGTTPGSPYMAKYVVSWPREVREMGLNFHLLYAREAEFKPKVHYGFAMNTEFTFPDTFHQ